MTLRLAVWSFVSVVLTNGDLYCSDGNHSACAGACADTFASSAANVVKHCLTWCKGECEEFNNRRVLQAKEEEEESVEDSRNSQCLATQVLTNVDRIGGQDERMEALEKMVGELKDKKCECTAATPGTGPKHIFGWLGDKLKFWDANRACMAMGYSKGLVKIDSDEKNAAVGEFVTQNCDEEQCVPWVGGYDHSAENSDWRWIDGSKIEYTNWSEGEPNNTDERCAHFYNNSAKEYNMKWNDASCFAGYRGVCEGTREDLTRVGSPPTKRIHVNQKLNFFDANNACVARGYWGLASVKDQATQDILFDIGSKVDNVDVPWIAGYEHDKNNENWRWLDGSAIEWENFSDGEPNGPTDEQCAHLYANYGREGKWNDAACSSKYSFFCEGSPSPVYSPKWGVIMEELSFNDAQNACRAAGFSRGLAQIADAATNTALVNLARSAGGDANLHAWIGLYDHSGSNDDWRWMDGEPLGWSNWNGGEPNGGAERCGMLYLNDTGKWNDATCETGRYWALCMG